MAVVFFCLVWLPCLLWFCPCAPSLEVVTFSLAPSRGPLGLPGFCWLPLGFGLRCLFWGSPCFPPVVSCLPWGCLCLVGAGRFGPPDAMEWLVVGAACCWRGRFWLLALLLLPPQFLCAVYLGTVQIKVNTMVLQSWVTATLELKESVLRSQSADIEVACSGQFIPSELLGRKSIQICLHLSQEI